MYVCMCTNMYVYVCMYVCMDVHICTHTHIYIYTYIYILSWRVAVCPVGQTITLPQGKNLKKFKFSSKFFQ